MDHPRPVEKSENDVSKPSPSIKGTGSERLLCADCGENEPVGDQLKKSGRIGTGFLALRRGLCTECLRRNDARIKQDLCGFLDCTWKLNKAKYYEHWARFHVPKTLECNNPDCSSTILFNPATLMLHERLNHIHELAKCDFADCPTVAKGTLFSKIGLKKHKVPSHGPKSLECDIPDCSSVKKGQKFNKDGLRNIRTHSTLLKIRNVMFQIVIRES